MAKALKKRPVYQQTQPLWDWTKGVTQGSLESFMACREQFALGYVEGWASKSFSVALEFGSVIHLMLERTGTASPEEVARTVTNQYEASRKKTLNPSDLGTMQLTLANAEAIFPEYVKYWAEYDSKINFLQREHVFKFPHQFEALTVGTDSNGAGFIECGHCLQKVDLTGMRDADYRNRLGDLGLFETKTKSQIDDVAIQDGLRADLQTCLYLYSLRREYNEEPKEILYNIIRRPQLRQKKDEHLDAYKQRVVEDIQARPEWYFRRYEVTVTDGDLENFIKTTLDPVLRQLLQWWESIEQNPFDRWVSPFHFRSLPALMTKYGKAWHYNLTVRGLKNEYYRKSSPFPELSESI